MYRISSKKQFNNSTTFPASPKGRELPTHHAIRHSRFLQEKARESLQSINQTATQGRIKRVCWDKRGKSLEAAAIKISVAFYKKLRSNLLYL